jgi:hypothetical protein
MYHLGRRERHNQKIQILIVLLCVIILVGTLIFILYKALQPTTYLGEGPTTTTHVSIPKAKTKTIKASIFEMQLPTDWQQVETHEPFSPLTWHGTTKDDNARQLQIYVDNLPTNQGINRMLPVRSDGADIVATDSISDNCVNFTDKNTTNVSTGLAPARWSGVGFWCDMANYERNLVGTSSPDSINSVSVTGPTKGVHKFFFVYTDHSSQADYTPFTDMLTSFRVL